MANEIKNLILGAGITGLTAASFLDDYLVLEKQPEVGGYCKTTVKNNFVWDYSGHFFHFKNEDIKNYLIENIDCDILEIKKNTKIFYKNSYIDFPFQHNIHQLSKEEFVECFNDLAAKKEIDKTNFKSYVKSALGESIANKFIIPYNEKLYACDLNELEYDSMGRFFPKIIEAKELLNDVKKDSYNDFFIYPKKGTFEFVKSILKRLDNNKIKTNFEVKKIDLENKLVYTKEEAYRFSNLINTLPFNKFLGLCGEDNKDFSFNKVVVFNLGFDFKSFQDHHWIYFPGNEVFYRVGFYDNILFQENMSLYVEIGMKSKDNINEDELLKKVLIDLKEAKIIKDHKLIDHQMVIMSPAYVHINKRSKEIYQKWCDLNNSRNIYSIGRYGSWTYCSIEDNIIEAMRVSKKL